MFIRYAVSAAAIMLLGATVAPGTVTTNVVNKTYLTQGEHARGIVKDPKTGDIYIGDRHTTSTWVPFVGTFVKNDDSIRRIGPSGNVQRIVDIALPQAMTWNSRDGHLYVAAGSKDAAKVTNGILRVDVATGKREDFAGSGANGYADGTGTQALFTEPTDVTFNPDNGFLYVAEPHHNAIRQISPSGSVSELADGFNFPEGLTYCTKDKNIYVADTNNNQIKRISTLTNAVSLVAGALEPGYADGPPAVARFNHPIGIACDDTGILYVTDSKNNAVRQIAPDGSVTTLAGVPEAGSTDGIGTQARFNQPGDITYDVTTGDLYVIDFGSNEIRRVATAHHHEAVSATESRPHR